MEKDEKTMVKCDYCGVLNDLKDGTCKYCGGVLHYDNSAELEALSKLNENNSKVPTEADLEKGAQMFKKIEGAVVITFRDGKRDIAIKTGDSSYTSLLSGSKYYDADYYKKGSIGRYVLDDYEGFYISKKELINEFMTAEEIEKKLTDTLTGRDVALIIYRTVNNLAPAKDYSVRQLKHIPNNTKGN